MIELLIVIAIIGALMAAVFVGLNPVQRLAQTRDATRIQVVGQLGRALDAYAVNNNGNYVVENATWITTLVTAGDITSIPSAPTYSITGTSACATNVQPAGGYCCDTTTPATGGGPIIVYARLEAASNTSKCTSPNVAFTAYSTADGRGGIVCAAAAGPGVGIQTFVN